MEYRRGCCRQAASAHAPTPRPNAMRCAIRPIRHASASLGVARHRSACGSSSSSSGSGSAVAAIISNDRCVWSPASAKALHFSGTVLNELQRFQLLLPGAWSANNEIWTFHKSGEKASTNVLKMYFSRFRLFNSKNETVVL